MHYRLAKNVVVTFEKDRIIFLKGVWKLIPFEVLKDDYKSNWKKIDQLFHKLSHLNESVLLEDNKEEQPILQLFQKLTNLNIIYVENLYVQAKHLVCSHQTYDFIESNKNNFLLLSKLNFIDISIFEQQKLDDLDDFLIICNNTPILKIRKINEKIVKMNKRYFLIILKSDFLHIFFHNNTSDSPCFECYYESVVSHMENENYLEFLKIKDFSVKSDNINTSELNYALSFFYLLLMNKNYFDDIKTNHRLISFYFPTLETNIINLRKKSDCLVCHK